MINSSNNNSYNIMLRCLSAMEYSPKIKKNKIASRPNNSLMLVVSGKYRYTFDKNVLEVNSGEMIYLPKGSYYNYEIISDFTQCLQFEFEAFNILSGERYILTENPYVIDCLDGAEEMIREVIKYHNRKNEGYDIMVSSIMYRLIYYILTKLKSVENNVSENRIKPAVEYIKKHFCEKIYVSHLAQLCLISESQLRRLFKENYNMSPIEYKNTMQMNTACELLRTGKTPAEITDVLGFDSVCSFSHIFKKVHGFSPMQYAKLCEK